MQRYFFITMTILALMVLVACRKDSISPGRQILPPDQQPLLEITPLTDTTILLPHNTAFLKGTLAGNSIANPKVEWKKISGPDTGSIENAFILETRAVNLVAGTYAFSLTVSNSPRITVRDTMQVQVMPDTSGYTREKIFDNLLWVSPMGSTTRIYAPEIILSGIPFRVLAKTTAGWDIVHPIQIYADNLPFKYYYQLYEKEMIIYTQVVPEYELTSAIKIQY